MVEKLYLSVEPDSRVGGRKKSPAGNHAIANSTNTEEETEKRAGLSVFLTHWTVLQPLVMFTLKAIEPQYPAQTSIVPLNITEESEYELGPSPRQVLEVVLVLNLLDFLDEMLNDSFHFHWFVYIYIY
ncbi:hypothetical protein Pfo_019355 [Paulownia fortunei]|nr:hypothetical protein Pfo_019355 [Paulownia fortunei]